MAVAAVLLLGMLMALIAPAVAAERAEVAPGVEYAAIRDPAGPYEIRVATVDLSATSTIDTALARDELPGFETTSSMARRHRAAVAVNGDFALSTGRPVHPYAQDGRLLQAPAMAESAFAVDQRETTGFVGLLSGVDMTLQRSDPDAADRIHRVNSGPPTSDDLAGFTAEGGDLERPPVGGCAARLAATDSPRLDSDGAVEIPYEVREARCGSDRLEPGDGMVLAGDRARSLGRDEQAALRWSVDWPGVMDLLGGNPVIVHEGAPAVVVDPADPNDRFFHANPRTGVGLTRDGRVLLVTVDGRQPGYSVGMTLRQFAELLARLGAWRALNLDGGGSTTMVVDGAVVNRPSDPGGERAVSSALLVLPGADPGETGGPAPAEASWAEELPRLDTWEDILSDPASTGGLIESLRLRGLLPASRGRLPPTGARG